MKKILATIGMALCAVVGLPFKLFSTLFGLLAALFGVSNFIPLLAVIGSFLTVLGMFIYKIVAGEPLVSTLVLGLISASLVAGVFVVLLNIWVIVASVLMKFCQWMQAGFGMVDETVYRGYSICKRHRTF